MALPAIEAPEVPIPALPPHVLRLARMIAQDCKTPGDYIIRIKVPDRPSEPVTMQTAKLDVIRDATAQRKG